MVNWPFTKRSQVPEEYRRNMERAIAAITTHGLCEGVPKDKLEKLFPACNIEEITDDEIVCHCAAELAHHDAFLVLDGKVAIKYRQGVLEHVLELAGYGALFNISNLVGWQGDDVGARALGRAEILAIDTEKLLKLFEDDPSIGYRMTRNLARLLMEQHKKHLAHYLQ